MAGPKHRANAAQSKQAGVALTEFALLLPVLLVLLAVVIDLTSTFWQMQFFFSATRHGARVAGSYAGWEHRCDQLVTLAANETNLYIQNGAGYARDRWNPATAQIEVKTWDGFSGAFLSINVTSAGSRATCLLCVLPLFGGGGPTARTITRLEAACV